MPAKAYIDRRERLLALAAVVFVQGALGLALLLGLRVDAFRHSELVSRLIDVTVAPPPPPPPPPVVSPSRPARKAAAAAPRAQPVPTGGMPGPARAAPLPALKPVVAVRPTAPPSGGGSGTGPAIGSGAGGGSGGEGTGGDEGGTDLVQIAGAITSSDYPRDLRDQGIGGRVEMVFTVGPSGRVTSCRITRSSGVRELDDLTCRLIQQRFLYRPSTDRNGRPFADEVEGEHDWVPGRR